MSAEDVAGDDAPQNHYSTLALLVQASCVGHPTPCARYDCARAQVEGWGVFDCGFREDGSPRVEL